MNRTILLALIQICLLQYSWARAATHVQSVHGRLTARAAPPRGPTSSPAAHPSDNDLLTRVDLAKDIGSLERQSQYALQPNRDPLQDAILDGSIWPVDSEFSDLEFLDKAEPKRDAMLGSDIRLALREARRPPSLLPEVLPYLNNERPQPVDQPPDLGNPKELGSWPGQWGPRPVETALMDEDGTMDSPTNRREDQPRSISQPREARKHVAKFSPDQPPSTHRKKMTTATPHGGGDSSGSRASALDGPKIKPGQAVAHGPGSEPGQGGPAPPDGRPKDGVNLTRNYLGGSKAASQT